MFEGHQEHNSPKNVPQVHGSKLVNLGFKKANDDPREPLKCWGCGKPHLLRICPYKNSTNKTILNIQEASPIRDIGKSIYRINATLDGRQEYHQYTIVEIEGGTRRRV